jgi:D-alanyl-D-alanine carboxypeptidase/D-alanyl-D-alanine-endopeptidase (penicillin-binding protein 4)
MKETRVKFILVGWMLCCAAILSPAQETNVARTVEALRAQLTAHVEQDRFSGALWGVKVTSLNSGKILFDHHADRLMSPASNSKMYPAALSLDRLGADYKIITPILAAAKPDADGTIHGDLVISGRGDPSWKGKYLGTNFSDLFSPFVAELKKAGVRHVTGDLIADTTFFRGPTSGGSWTVEDLSDSEGAEVSAITLNDNLTQLRVKPAAQIGALCAAEISDLFTGLVIDNRVTTAAKGTPRRVEMWRNPGENVLHVFGVLPMGAEPELLDVPVPRTAAWFAAALKDALKENGITVGGAARAIYWPDAPSTAAEKIGEVKSPPLAQLVKDFMKPSQNLETDLIFDHTGEMLREKDSPTWLTSEQSAVAELEKLLRTNGLPATDVHFDEGSGLSRNNLTTANASVALLQFMAKHKASQAWEESLPIAGVDGTIRRRMKGTAAEKNVHAKTGTLRWVNALSGYVTNAAGEKLVFSLMLNRYDSPPNRKRTDELDDIAVMLARSDFRTDEPLEKKFSALGTLIVTQFISAPFPHPDRANGRTRNGQFYSAKEHYSDSTVAMFIPKGFRATDKIDFVVHFHGWGNTVAGTLEQFNLVQQFCDSGKNAILIIPEGPHNAPDSFGGKLEDTNGFKVFMSEAVEKLRTCGALGGKDFSIGKIILSGHSGGYHVMAGIVDRGGLPITEAWLYDALYGNVENFVAWQKRELGRMVNIYTDHGGTKDESEKLMGFYRTNRVSFVSLEETNSTLKDLAKSKTVFIHTDLTHNEVIFRRGEFAQFLKTSCLKDK